MPDIAEPMTDNEALRRILAAMEDVASALKEEYDSIISTGDLAITTALSTIRAASGTAVTTVIINKGAQPVHIFEDDNLVMIVPAATSRELALKGDGILKAQTVSGASTLRVTTYRLS